MPQAIYAPQAIYVPQVVVPQSTAFFSSGNVAFINQPYNSQEFRQQVVAQPVVVQPVIQEVKYGLFGRIKSVRSFVNPAAVQQQMVAPQKVKNIGRSRVLIRY